MFTEHALSKLDTVNLTLSMLDKKFSRRHFVTFFLFFQENRFWHCMHIDALGDTVYARSKPIFWGK